MKQSRLLYYQLLPWRFSIISGHVRFALVICATPIKSYPSLFLLILAVTPIRMTYFHRDYDSVIIVVDVPQSVAMSPGVAGTGMVKYPGEHSMPT
jgi:hypothetical protein